MATGVIDEVAITITDTGAGPSIVGKITVTLLGTQIFLSVSDSDLTLTTQTKASVKALVDAIRAHIVAEIQASRIVPRV